MLNVCVRIMRITVCVRRQTHILYCVRVSTQNTRRRGKGFASFFVVAVVSPQETHIPTGDKINCLYLCTRICVYTVRDLQVYNIGIPIPHAIILCILLYIRMHPRYFPTKGLTSSPVVEIGCGVQIIYRGAAAVHAGLACFIL